MKSLLARLFPLPREIRHGVTKNFEKCFSIIRTELREVGARIFPGQHFVKPVIDVPFGGFGDRIPIIGVNQVAAGITENSGLQIEVAQGTAFAISWAERFKILLETGRALDRIVEPNLVGEEQIAQEIFSGLL